MKIFPGGLWVAGLCLTFLPAPIFADDYVGASAALNQIARPPAANETNTVKSSEAAQLKRDIESFQKQQRTLAPDAAAKQWLELLDRQLSLSLPQGRNGAGSEDMFDPQKIWHALPPPASWSALRQAVEARPPGKGKAAERELALRLIAHTLVVDRAAQTNDVANLEALVARRSREDGYALASIVEQINDQLADRSDDPTAVMKSLERRLARMQGEQESYRRDFSVPNLVPLVGAEKSEVFLRRALTTLNVEIEINRGEDTRKLARRLALELVDRLKVPQWGLAHSLDAGALYEAMDKKFTTRPDTNEAAVVESPAAAALMMRRPSWGSANESREQARIYYFLGLIAQNRSKEAVALAQKSGPGSHISVPGDALKHLQQAGYTKATHDFFRELLSQNPDLPYWDEYIALAAQVRQTAPMLELARKAAAREDVSDRQRSLIRQNLYKALLAAGEVDEGIVELRQLATNKNDGARSRYEMFDSHEELALSLAKLGHVLGRTNLVQEGIGLALASLKESPSPDRDSSAGQVSSLADFLVEIGRGPEAERLLIDALAKSRSSKTQDGYGWNAAPQSIYLAELVKIYHRAGRHADVILLVDQSPDWRINDLLELRGGSYGMFHSREDSADDSLRYWVATALNEQGRKEQARKLVDSILDQNGGYDPAYELLLKIGGNDLMARLDALFARDQFEERPLIWKAVLLQQAGRLPDAEATARRAISIDPSDGEQGPGRRMRAYAVLADIRAARGDKAEADLFRGAVAAIRLSENADRFYEAGLLRQAINMYEDSLQHFEAAYCIQSRLALRLSELGQYQEAEQHYRRAYELMPESFGRVESHCFGCERAFDGEQAQRIAETIFTSLTKTSPLKPQVHYLLGYLREEQGRYAEALASYRTAVMLDPDYLNAWTHIQSVGGEYPLKVADRDSIALTVLRLDPTQRHSCSGFSEMTDVRALWNAVEAAAKFHPAPVTSVYPLPASKAELEKEKSERKSDERSVMERTMSLEMMLNSKTLQPADAVLQNGVISSAISLLKNDDAYSFPGID